MLGGRIGAMPGSLAATVRRGRWWRFSWNISSDRDVSRADEQSWRLFRFRYHLGRGRRAREAGRFAHGAVEARRALALNPREPWALALLGQCLLKQHPSNLAGARQALECAQALEPTNGYFIRLLLDVMAAQGDQKGRDDLLTRAWWTGAPVERWLPDGPPRRQTDRTTDEAVASQTVQRPEARPAAAPVRAGRRSVHAYATS